MLNPSLIQHIRAVDRDEGWLIAFIKPSFVGFLLVFPRTHTYHSQIHVKELMHWQQAGLEILPFSTFLPPSDTNTDRILGLWQVFPGWILLVCGGNFFILAISDVLSQIRQPNGGGGGEMFLHRVLSVFTWFVRQTGREDREDDEGCRENELEKWDFRVPAAAVLAGLIWSKMVKWIW